MVILEAGEDDDNDDDDSFNNTEVLYSTILDDPHQNISKKEPIATYSVPNNY